MFTNRRILDREIRSVKAGESTSLSFQMDSSREKVDGSRYRLRLRGRTGIHPSLMYEGGLPYLYRDIEDSLSRETDHSRFSLKITASGEEFPRCAYYKILCPPMINSQYPVPESDDYLWRFQGTVKAENFFVLPGGRGEIAFECYWKKEGRDPRDICGQPDSVTTVKLPAGSWGYGQIEGFVPIGPETAAVFVTIAVEKAVGTVWLEDFSLSNANGFNILPPFDLTNQYHPFMNWMGENLCHKEWNCLKMVLNGQELKTGPLFQRCYSGAENEIEIPKGWVREGKNDLTLWNEADYFCPPPYVIKQIELLWEEKRSIELVSVPEYVSANQEFGILVRTYEQDCHVSLTVDDGLKVAEGNWRNAYDCGNAEEEPEGGSCFYCREAGLHVFKLLAKEAGEHLAVTICSGEEIDTSWIRRIVEKTQDGVLLGSGDAIYIPQETQEMEEFLCWYLSNQLGNMMTFRPVYRWAGSRSCNPRAWERITELCNSLKLWYCYIIEGRELPGINANPTEDMMNSPYYLGNQGHERDGALYYWQQNHWQRNDTLFEEVSRKVFQHPDFLYRPSMEYGEKDVYFNFSPEAARNMEEGAGQFVAKAREALRGVKRHTGPSTLFRYLYEAGVEVCGAELMYGPQEVILSALRGASIAYDRDIYTAHLAMQWSTTPHNTPAHCRRFRLALFISYLHGCSHINTEEGLYRLEEYFAEYDRFSDPCISHGQVQREFLHFIQTHSRRGRMVSPIALIHGRSDGWVCFTRRNVWSQDGEEWKFDTPEESWDLLKVFYPDAVLDAIYRHPCPDGPQGYYSRTPYGTVDILPQEASPEKYKRYGHMAFLGFHTAQDGMVEQLCDYVREGGRLLLGWCHLFTDRDRHSALYGTPHPLEASALTGVTLREFLPETAGLTMGRIELSDPRKDDVTVCQERNGIPFLLKHRIGKGTVYFINAREYPASPGVRDTYETVLKQFGSEAVEECSWKGWAESQDTIGTAVYDREDGHRIIYAVNTGWWSESESETWMKLRLHGEEYQIPVPRDVITQITIKEDIAVVISDMETEVLEICPGEKGFSVWLQGQGEARIRICCPGETVLEREQIRQKTGENIIGKTLHGKMQLRFSCNFLDKGSNWK